MKRARTLALFLLLLSCTTAILEGYEETLAAHVSLSFFVPFLIGCGAAFSILAFVYAIDASYRLPIDAGLLRRLDAVDASSPLDRCDGRAGTAATAAA